MTDDDEMEDGMPFTEAWANHINALTNDVRTLQQRNSELQKALDNVMRSHGQSVLFLRVLMDKQVEAMAKGQGDVTKAAEAYAQAFSDTYCMLHGTPEDQRDAAAEAAGKAAWDKEVAKTPKPRKTLRAVVGDTVES